MGFALFLNKLFDGVEFYPSNNLVDSVIVAAPSYGFSSSAFHVNLVGFLTCPSSSPRVAPAHISTVVARRNAGR